MVTEFLISPSESSSDSSPSPSSSSSSSSPSSPAIAPVCCGRAEELGFLAFFIRLGGCCISLDGSVIAPWVRCCEGKGGWLDLLGVEAVELGAWNSEIAYCVIHTPNIHTRQNYVPQHVLCMHAVFRATHNLITEIISDTKEAQVWKDVKLR